MFERRAGKEVEGTVSGRDHAFKWAQLGNLTRGNAAGMLMR